MRKKIIMLVLIAMAILAVGIFVNHSHITLRSQEATLTEINLETLPVPIKGDTVKYHRHRVVKINDEDIDELESILTLRVTDTTSENYYKVDAQVEVLQATGRFNQLLKDTKIISGEAIIDKRTHAAISFSGKIWPELYPATLGYEDALLFSGKEKLNVDDEWQSESTFYKVIESKPFMSYRCLIVSLVQKDERSTGFGTIYLTNRWPFIINASTETRVVAYIPENWLSESERQPNNSKNSPNPTPPAPSFKRQRVVLTVNIIEVRIIE